MKMCFITSGRKFVEVANPGPRPEKPIEIYEFEGYITCLSLASNIFFSLVDNCLVCFFSRYVFFMCSRKEGTV